ncbi:MAG: sulfotransferase [Marmoricola sp.]|nr:sulfotransferase [Marmoricola sp.]
MRAAPILVTGSHRSGSTWVGRLLSLDHQAHYVHEPLNPDVLPSWFGRPAEHTWEHLPAGDDRWHRIDRIVALRFPAAAGFAASREQHGTVETARRIARITRAAAFARHDGSRALVKDPFMLFNSDEFVRRYDGKVVFTVRNPAAFVSSLLRLGWRFDFDNWAMQRSLMEGALAPWAEEIRAAAADPPPMFEHACLAWRVLHGFMAASYAAAPKNKVMVLHDQLSSDVPGRLPGLLDAVGLEHTDEIAAGVRGLTTGDRRHDVTASEVNTLDRDSASTGQVWRLRLTEEQAERAFELSQPEAAHFYPEGTRRA